MKRLLVLCVAILPAVVLQAQNVAVPESVGLSTTGLSKIAEILQRHVDIGGVPGAIALVARNGHIAYWEARGSADPAKTIPLKKDMAVWVGLTRVEPDALVLGLPGNVSVDQRQPSDTASASAAEPSTSTSAAVTRS